MIVAESPPAREAWIEICAWWAVDYDGVRRLPRGRRGLKLICVARTAPRLMSPPAREAWIEIARNQETLPVDGVASREGGVD